MWKEAKSTLLQNKEKPDDHLLGTEHWLLGFSLLLFYLMSSLLYTFFCSLLSGTECGKISFWSQIYTYSSYSPGVKNLFQHEGFITLPIWCKFKIISLKSDFKHIFNDYIHVYSPSIGADNPLGTKFWCQQKAPITLPICCKFQKDFFEIWFYTHFLMILYVYITPRQGQKNPWGQNFNVNRKPLSLRPFVARFKEIALKSDFIHIF